MAKYKRNSNGDILINGFSIPQAQVKQYQTYNKRANVKRTYHLKLAQQLRKDVDSRIPPEAIFDKKTNDLSRFNSYQDFMKAFNRVERQTNKDYMNYRYETEKSNMIRAISQSFPDDDAKILIDKLENINSKTIHIACLKGELGHTGYIYHDPERTKFNHLLNQINKIVN